MLHMDPMLQNSGTTGLRKAAKLNLGFAIPSDWHWLRLKELLISPLPSCRS